MPIVKTCYASALRTETPTPMSTVNNTGRDRGLIVVVDTTAVEGAGGDAPSTVVTIQGYDSLSAKWYTILASAALTAVGTVVLRVFPGATAASNLTANDVLPNQWRVIATHGNGKTHTYSISAQTIP